jgi:hypothetical protein
MSDYKRFCSVDLVKRIFNYIYIMCVCVIDIIWLSVLSGP